MKVLVKAGKQVKAATLIAALKKQKIKNFLEVATKPKLLLEAGYYQLGHDSYMPVTEATLKQTATVCVNDCTLSLSEFMHICTLLDIRPIIGHDYGLLRFDVSDEDFGPATYDYSVDVNNKRFEEA